MTDYEQQHLAALERISAQQIELASGQQQLASTLDKLIAELQKPAETNVLDELRKLLAPLASSLAELSRKLPEPQAKP